MTILVVGASGATGKHVVEQLLKDQQKVRVIVRSPDKLPEHWKKNEQLSIIQGSVSDFTVNEMAEYIQGCQAVASCLGHSVNLKGLYGKPRRLVTDTVELLSHAIKKNDAGKPVKFVLMNTSGNRDRDLDEPISKRERLAIALLRLVLPPHVDNEKAADYLRTQVGQNSNFMEWVAVRPDGLVNEEHVTEYEVYPSPIRSAIFDAGTVSRINVGHFMAKLMEDQELWNKWKGQMPVIYSKTS
ncbi:NAD(P)-dependent oxidoreductase [Algoriphagus halophilus]|uniref:NAD(P)H-binding n=1 Tax=Algoriphagus halophilus TaxID=226505 RepID=A0A1N6H1P8_9BACT|nr:NAD(P)-binding oxidoreductase [Algoriphagus halophilus]SIO13612.1 NAD(P)H-binding [Algoriphagus halophilus]